MKTGVDVSTSRTYVLSLSGSVKVSVELTGMTIDFDCRVGSRRCTNNRGTADDSWSGPLKAGRYWVAVYPHDAGPGSYSLTVTATETLGVVATPLAGGPVRIWLCDEDDGRIIESSCREVVSGFKPGQGNPGSDGGDGGGDGSSGGGSDDDDEKAIRTRKENKARDDATARARRFDCRVFFRTNGEPNILGALASVSFNDKDSRNQCTDSGDSAYTLRPVDGVKDNTIYTCPLFYDGSRSLRAETVLHEMLHLAGTYHEKGSEAAFHQALLKACP